MSEREPPDCGRCGQPLTVLEWIDITRCEDPEPETIAGRTKCENAACPDRNWHMPEDREWLKRQMRLVERAT